MSRVDDAMRRASGAVLTDQPAPVPEVRSAVPAADLAELSSEPFPEEETPAAAAAPAGSDGAPPERPHLVAAPAQVTNTADPLRPHKISSENAPVFQRISAGMKRKLVIDTSMAPGSREQYRRLAATLHQAQVAHGVKAILVSSAVAGEGKTLTTSNLALTFSESYHRSVLLIDADLRRPSLNTVFKINGVPGLVEGLSSQEEKPLPLHEISQRLSILPAGKPSSDPMAGLTSNRMRRLIAEARELFDWVIIDTPPVGLMSDANLLTAMVDAAVLVVHAGSTPYNLVQRAADALGRERILGVVLNRSMKDLGASDYYTYYGAHREGA